MQNICCICGKEDENLEQKKIFRNCIHKWAAPLKKAPADIYDSPWNMLPMCNDCAKHLSIVPFNKSEINSLHITDEERTELLKLYRRLSDKILIFNRILFSTALKQGSRCCECGKAVAFGTLTLHRYNHDELRSLHNAKAVCRRCVYDKNTSNKDNAVV